MSLAKTLVGEVRGMAEVERMLSNININGCDVIYFLAPSGTWNINFSDKFLTITIFNYSFNLFLLTAIVSFGERFLERDRIRTAILLSVILAGIFLFHVIAGITLLFTFVSSGILMAVASRYFYRENWRPANLVTTLIIAFLVSIIALPYFRSLTSGANDVEGNLLVSNRFHFGYRNTLTVLLPLLVLFFPARQAFRKILGGRDHASRMILMWIIALLIITIFINIGTVGEKKCVYFVLLILAPPVCVQVVESINRRIGFRRSLLIAAVMVLFIVPPVLTFRGFIMEKPSEGIGERRYLLAPEDRIFFDWLKDNTAADAVIAENNTYHLSPVYAGRRNLFSWYYVIKGLRYGGPDFESFREIQTYLYGEGEIGETAVQRIRDFNQKVYVLVWWDDFERFPWLVDRYRNSSELFKEVYGSERVSLYTLKE